MWDVHLNTNHSPTAGLNSTSGGDMLRSTSLLQVPASPGPPENRSKIPTWSSSSPVAPGRFRINDRLRPSGAIFTTSRAHGPTKLVKYVFWANECPRVKPHMWRTHPHPFGSGKSAGRLLGTPKARILGPRNSILARRHRSSRNRSPKLPHGAVVRASSTPRTLTE
jgi:hypothetical protein